MSRRIWRWIAVVMMMAVTFVFGTDYFSSENTRPIIRWLMVLLFGSDAGQATVGTGEGFLRKSAHFTEYALLAFLWYRALRDGAGRRWRFSWALPAWLLTTAWAGVDELQQAYMSTQRTGAVADVVLDSSGAAAALLLVGIVAWWHGAKENDGLLEPIKVGQQVRE
jgi:VanZ family protein